MNYSNYRMAAALCLLACPTLMTAQSAAVVTGEYDNARTSSNSNEYLLNPFTVKVNSFGKTGYYSVDGQVVGQPLYMPSMLIGKKFVNVLYVTTMNNSVYAFDADHPGTAPLWNVNLGPSVPATYAGTCPAQYSMGNQMGILSTPVIDPANNTMYVVSASPIPNVAMYYHTLYALDLVTGKQTHGGSQRITATVSGNGSTSTGGKITLSETMTAQRPALLLSNNVVYIGMSSCGPNVSPYHGWVIGYSADNVKQQTMAYNTTPNGDKGGIWQAGRGLVADAFGSIYFATGNGTTDDISDYGESVVKLSPYGQVESFFTPPDYLTLTNLDLDLSTTSPLLTPDTNLLVASGKEGLLYVMRSSLLGGLAGALQTFVGGMSCPETYNGCQKIHSLAYWSGAGILSRLYTWGTNDTLRAYREQFGRFVTTPDSQGSEVSAYPGGILTVTSSLWNPASGILWALTPGELHAFSASNVSQELWNSNQDASRDALPGNYHFEQFTVVAGRVYVPDNQNRVVVYGLLHSY